MATGDTASFLYRSARERTGFLLIEVQMFDLLQSPMKTQQLPLRYRAKAGECRRSVRGVTVQAVPGASGLLALSLALDCPLAPTTREVPVPSTQAHTRAPQLEVAAREEGSFTPRGMASNIFLFLA